ncbi:anthrone oxygenase family protein [Jiangella rhizosphaerae]|uniref:DUF1772 domain-containing protein n=1 Tax=Jiangella rhizosphaerae TaxID=2293569 RepID=A0A418KJB5_9ACTN|nr:anthrone oxygenase family protein [Jiangella rhizosphaerae]RIQ14468.1 DUF1772 domain-containing protein [Jiangella rhizosphaerae]
MSDRVESTATVIAITGSALLAGLWFFCSVVLMPALSRRPVPEAIAAMQEINVVILNPVFGLAFGGTALLSLGLAVGTLFRLDRPASGLLLAAAAVILVGTFVVTMALNVPLNDQLAAVDPAGAAGAEVWARYLSRWTAWNHVRLVSSTASVVLFATYLIRR